MFDTFGQPVNFVEGDDDGPADEGMGGSYGEDDPEAWDGQGKGDPEEDWSDGPTVPGEDWTDQDWPEQKQQGDYLPDEETAGKPFVPPEEAEAPGKLEQLLFDQLSQEGLAGEEPIEVRASEAEKLYANLLMKTDFERDFIEEMLEFDPDEEAEMRIDELRRKRREMKEMAQQMPPMAPQSPQGTTTILI